MTNSLSALKSKEKIKSKYWDCNFPQVLQDIDVNEDFIDATKT